MSISDRLGNGSISPEAVRRYLRSTSNPADGEVWRDDGGNWQGLVSRDQINAAQQPGRGNPDENPQADYGPDDLGSIDSKANRRGNTKQSKLSPERSARLDRGASDKRSAATVDNEWNPRWFDKANNLR
jgi:hypothetical protein